MYRFCLFLLSVVACDACNSRGASEWQVTDAGCRPGGALRAELYGAVRTELAWEDGQLQCEGMPRPFDEGARLRFAGSVRDGDATQQLAFIVAIPGLQRAGTGRELPATVTLIDEDSGRFFSNAERETCWADIDSQAPLPGNGDSFAISGIVYCVAPLAEIASKASITIRNLQFAGRVNWRGADK